MRPFLRPGACLLVASLLAVACADGGTSGSTAGDTAAPSVPDDTAPLAPAPSEAGTTDARTTGAGTTDAGTTDAGTTDAGTTGTSGGEPAVSGPPYEVARLDGGVDDPSRDRMVPYRVYAPVGLDGPVPVVIVSHGGFGSFNGFRSAPHLGMSFASAGLLAIHIGHLPSEQDALQLIDRPADVTFLLDRIAAGDLLLPEGVTVDPDLERVGVVGHSFGAYTAHAVGGAAFARSFRDERVDAIVPISPQGPDQFTGFDNGPGDSTWTSVEIPVYVLVGSEEIDSNALDDELRPGWRLVPFQRYPGTVDTFQTILAGQDHGDMWSQGNGAVEGYIAGQVLTFLRVYVAGDGTADPCTIGAASPTGDPQVESARRPGSASTRLAGCS